MEWVSRDRVRRYTAGAAVSTVGLAALLVPLYDIWDDVSALGWSPTATLVENATMLVMALVLLGAGVWLVRSDWETDRVTTVAGWTALGAVSAGVLFGWVLTVQLWSMHALKPVVIAMDAVVFASITSLGIGLYSAQRDREQARLRTERDRFSGLFENTTDAVAAVSLDAGEPAVEAVNHQFEHTFSSDPATVLSTVMRSLDGDRSRREVFERVGAGETFESTIHRETGDGSRSFVVRLVPFGGDGQEYLYLVVTDITDQQELARERAANDRLESLHAVASDLQSVETPTAARDLAVDAVEELLSPDRVRYVDEAGGDDGAANEVGAAADAAGVSGSDEPELRTRVGDRVWIEVYGGPFAEREVRTVELLATHLDRTLARLEREQRIEDERQQLEFINRTVRHNLLNKAQIVQGHLELLDEDEFRDHRDIVADAVDDMAEFVRTMRAYTTALVEGEDHELEPVDLRPVVVEEVESARTSHPDVAFDCGEIPAVSVRADELLGPLFRNLLRNAVEHNDAETPRVRVDAAREDGAVTVSVTDNGPGVPDDRKEEIFGQGEYGSHSSGSGFGLYLVRTAAEAYGGSVEVVDAEPTGARFRVTLPLADTGEQSVDG